MNQIYLMTMLLLGLTSVQPAYAQVSASPAATIAPAAAPQADAAELADPLMDKISMLQNGWADIKYGTADRDSKLAALDTLEKQAAGLVAENPARAEPKIWDAIIISTQAGLIKGVSALPKVKHAKRLLEEALRVDAKALDGSAHTSLGSLYYQVPGWPISFGDDKKAEEHLKTALAINPDGIDPNFFYGDFLLKQKRYAEAAAVLTHAKAAPAREGRSTADAGRQREIAEALAQAQEGAAKTQKPDFN